MENWKIGSTWKFECFRGGNKVWDGEIKNVMTLEGRNHLLNVGFNNGAKITPWYILIFESNTTPDETATYASPVFTESIAYSESTRSLYVPNSSSAGITTNAASKGTFTFDSDRTIYGGALVGGGSAASTKGNTAGGGVLMCAAPFADPKSALVDDILRVTVSIQLYSA